MIGLDVGCSPKRRSSAICRLDWAADGVAWTLRRFRATPEDRESAVAAVVDRPVMAAALDGPLQRGFTRIGRYRRAEQMLTLGLQPLIGKPGQSSAPVGMVLNDHANLCATALTATGLVGPAGHAEAIDALAIVEAFPSSFLGLLLADPGALTARRGNRSDTFFKALAADGTLTRLLAALLPGRQPSRPWESVTDHDERAALVCALTALGVAAGDYAAVGDALGWIILPPARVIAPWALAQLRANAARIGGGLTIAA